MSDVQHPVTFEGLVDYAEGRLDAAEMARVSEHLQTGCATCECDLQWIRRVLGLMAAGSLVSAPPELVQRVQALYTPPRRRARLSLGGLWAPVCRQRYAAAIVLACLLIFLSGWWAWGNTTVAQAATLAEVGGPVEVRLAGTDEWQPAIPGMALAAGSAVRSGDGATAILLYADGSRTYLAPEAEVEILSVSGLRNLGASNVRLNLVTGQTAHDLATGRGSVQVQVPGGVAEARKGHYQVRVEGDTAEVDALASDVAVKVKETKTHLSPGERGHLKEGRLEVTRPKADPGEGPAAAKGNDDRGQSQAAPPVKTPPSNAAQAKPKTETPALAATPTPTPAHESRAPAAEKPRPEAADGEGKGQEKEPPSPRANRLEWLRSIPGRARGLLRER